MAVQQQIPNLNEDLLNVAAPNKISQRWWNWLNSLSSNSVFATVTTGELIVAKAGSPFFVVSVPDPSAVAPVIGPWTGGAGAIAQVAVDVGNSGFMAYPSTGANAGQNFYFMANLSYDGTNYRYKAAGAGAELSLLGDSGHGYIELLTVPVGAAGAIATVQSRMTLGPTGVNVAAPTSGTSLTVNSLTNGLAQVWNDGVRNVELQFIASGAQFGLTTAHNLQVLTKNTLRLLINSTGNASFQTPDSGVTVTIDGTTVINSPASGSSLTVNGPTGTNDYAVSIAANLSTGISSGLYISAGTNSADNTVAMQNASGSATYFAINGDGSGNLGPVADTEGLSWSPTGVVTLYQTPVLSGATTGAKTAAMTATNKPGTNNQTEPALWAPVTLGGSLYYLPAYAP